MLILFKLYDGVHQGLRGSSEFYRIKSLILIWSFPKNCSEFWFYTSFVSEVVVSDYFFGCFVA